MHGLLVYWIGDYMENIITEILEIENNAQKRITDAEQQCIQIIADAKAEKENLINNKIQEAENRIKFINSEEQRKAEKNLNEIEKNKQEAIAKLDDIYNSAHIEWEENIFNSIING